MTQNPDQPADATAPGRVPTARRATSWAVQKRRYV